MSTLKATKLFPLKTEVASSGVKPWPTIADSTQLGQQRHPEDNYFFHISISDEIYSYISFLMQIIEITKH